MPPDCTYLPYSATHAFSALAKDYVQGHENLQPFFKHPVSLEGLKEAIAARQAFGTNRTLLTEVLTEQYAAFQLSPAQQSNLDALAQPGTFTITTAHQPNIFTGPLYFIYKILHAIKLAAELGSKWPDYRFVPVYYMGSEDADLDELGFINLSGDKLVWDTDQAGAVGRMNTKGLEKIITRLSGEFGHLSFGAQMTALVTEAYTRHANIQQATLFLVNELFKDYGLLVLIPDNARLKAGFHQVIKKELTEQFSAALVAKTAEKIGKHYKVQAAGRALNLFYLNDEGRRERLERTGFDFVVPALNLSFSEAEILTELEQHPERFSANVILRGVFQETILPNIAFIGGGGELAYWLELKDVFEAAGVPYPVLILRNSFLLMSPRAAGLQQKLSLSAPELLLPELQLSALLATRQATNRIDCGEEQRQISDIYAALGQLALRVDATLKPHVAALHTRTLNGLRQLDKKLLRAEKRNQAESQQQLKTLRGLLFPNQNLQEREDNFMPLFAKYGPALIDAIYRHSLCLEQQFAVLYLPTA